MYRNYLMDSPHTSPQVHLKFSLRFSSFPLTNIASKIAKNWRDFNSKIANSIRHSTRKSWIQFDIHLENMGWFLYMNPWKGEVKRNRSTGSHAVILKALHIFSRELRLLIGVFSRKLRLLIGFFSILDPTDWILDPRNQVYEPEKGCNEVLTKRSHYAKHNF